MKNMSQILKSIKEARSNAPINPKQNPTEQVKEVAKQLGYPFKVIGVSYTDVDKLGINPGSKYNTPLGIYAYPYKWIDLSMPSSVSLFAFLPFQTKAKFVNVFSIKPSATIMYLGDEDEEDSEKTLFFLNRIKKYLIDNGVSQKEVSDKFEYYNSGDGIWKLSFIAMELFMSKIESDTGNSDEKNVHADGQHYPDPHKFDFSEETEAEALLKKMWFDLFEANNITMPNIKNLSTNQRKQLALKLYSQILKTRKRFAIKQSIVKKKSLLWNKMMRDIGIDVVIDMGTGTIHKSEKTQMVVFNPNVIEKVVRISNTWQKEEGVRKDRDKEKLIKNALERRTLTKKSAIQILELPEDAIDENIYAPKKYTWQFSPIKMAIIDLFSNVTFNDITEKSIAEFDENFKYIQKVFGNIPASEVEKIISKFYGESLQSLTLDGWKYLLEFTMKNLDTKEIYAANVFSRLLSYLSDSTNYHNKISENERRQILRKFMSTEYWKKIKTNQNLAGTNAKVQKFLGIPT